MEATTDTNSSANLAEQQQSDGEKLVRCFVQFTHPGDEHGPDRPGGRSWNLDLHRRKFLEADAVYRATPTAPPTAGDVAFWGEWEPESDVEAIPDPTPNGPRFLHRPYWTRPDSYLWYDDGGREVVRQNTDPFVFGDGFRYTLCRQWVGGGKNKPRRVTYLRSLASGSLILFGSHKGGEFLLDTVFVASDSVLHSPNDWESMLDGRISETYANVTVKASHAWGGDAQVRLYSGATPEAPVDGMFSFVPCLPAIEAAHGFERPTIRLDNVINPKLKMSSKATRGIDDSQMRSLWSQVVDQVVDAGLSLGTRFETPPMRQG